MNNIWNSIKLDYYILKSSDFRRIGIIVLIALFVSFTSKDPLLVLGIIMAMAGFLMSTIFAVVEKNNLNKLYGILPVQKKETVIGRYVFTLIAGLIVAIVAVVFVFALSFFLNSALTSFAVIAWLSGSFLLFCLIVGVQFPLYFKYDFSKLAAFANIPYILVILIGTLLVKRYPKLFTQAIAFFVHNPYMIWVAGIVGALLLLGISLVISIALYKTREL